MQFEVTLHLSKNKKIASFYIPKIYEAKILKFKGLDSVVTCLDCNPQIKFVTRLTTKPTKNYIKYIFPIPKRHISTIISTIREYYKIEIKKL